MPADVSFGDYFAIDSDVAVAGTVTDRDIIAEVLDGEGESGEEDEDLTRKESCVRWDVRYSEISVLGPTTQSEHCLGVEESKMPPRPPPPQPQRPEAGQILLLVKQDGSAASGGRLLLPRPLPQPPPPPQQVLAWPMLSICQIAEVRDSKEVQNSVNPESAKSTDCSSTNAILHKWCSSLLKAERGAALQQPVVGRGGLLLEQPTSAKATNLQKPPLLQQQHVLANGQPPPDPDSIPVLEPITAEEHFHAEMLHQTIKGVNQCRTQLAKHFYFGFSILLAREVARVSSADNL
ncbi:hypothetical protein HPB51_012608 [Rhipicephalus microplus]|uniref:Uncharacterized protein n=1 Tax=Rhipicephalus microplus TaxID=6941 RepID=A0A9J6E115_RHIMP|nr:hypothetical protein HPB51_012608 [Rhipicephalus microplus]